MLWQPGEPHFATEGRDTVVVFEDSPGPARTAALEDWLDGAAKAGYRTWLLRCAPETGGIWAGVAELVESLTGQIEQDAPFLLDAHGYEISLVLPRYRASLEVSRPLTDIAAPDERTRNYPADRAYRSLHGLIDLLAEWHDLGDGRPWAIACDDFDRANGLVRRFFTELTRRRGDRLGLRLLFAGAPAQGEELVAAFRHVAGTAGVRPGGARPPSPGVSFDPAVVASEAGALERQVAQDPSIEDTALPRLIWSWQQSGHPERALRWQVLAINGFNHTGLYEASLEYCDAVEANLDRVRAMDRHLYFLAVNGLFFCLVPLGHVDRARKILEGALEHLDPTTLPRIYYLLAMLHARFLEARDLEQADHYLTRALDLLPEVAVTADDRQFMTVFLMNGLALVRVRQRRPQDAVDLCQAGLARLDRHLEPGKHRLHRSVLFYNIAQVYAQIGPDDLAIQYFGQTMELDPNYSEYYNDRGAVYFKMGRFEVAAQDYLAAIRLSPPYAEVNVNLGQCYRAMGRMQDAITAYSRALDLDPASALALIGRADAYSSLGDDDLALADYDEALRLEPAQPLVLASRAIVHFEHHRIDQALEDLDQAVAQAPDIGELRQNRAVALLAAGRIDEAAGDLQTYLELCPDAEDRGEVEFRLDSLAVAGRN